MLKFPKNTWYPILKTEFEKPYFIKLNETISVEYNNFEICPQFDQIFRAFDVCSFESVKVVILGQDPYHDINQANGLAFSVNTGTKIPPSLRNIYKELKQSTGIDKGNNGDLNDWAKQGVLLLNTILTVRLHQAGSHTKYGWQLFTDAVIEKIDKNKNNVIFVLWGAPAQKKTSIINNPENKVLVSAHPSPLSVFRGFFGNNHFTEINNYFASKNISAIEW